MKVASPAAPWPGPTPCGPARDAGVLCEFEGFGFDDALDFTQLGINLTLLTPAEPMAWASKTPAASNRDGHVLSTG